MSDFDPYRDWLGVRVVERPLNLYELLGLPAFTKEPPVIADAADEQVARLQPHAAGPQAGLAQQLLREVAEARRVLLSADSRKAYDAELRRVRVEGGTPAVAAPAPPPAAPAAPVMAAPPPLAPPIQAMPQVPPSAPPQAFGYAQPYAAPYAQPQPMAGGVPMATPVGVAPVMRAVPVALHPMYAQPLTVPVPFDAGEDDLDRATRIYHRSRRSGWPMAIAILLLAIVMIGGALAFANRDKVTAMFAAPYPPAARPAEVARAPQLAEPLDHGTQPGTKDDAVAALASAMGMSHTTKPTDASVSRMPPPVKPEMSDRMAMTTTTSEPSGLLGRMDPSFAGTDPKANLQKQLDASPSLVGRSPQTAGVLAKTTPPASGDELTSVTRSIGLVRKALTARNVVQAREQLDLATLEAFSTDTVTSVDRTTALVEAVDQFWKAVADGAKELKPKEVLDVGDEKVTIVAVEEGKLSVRIGSQSRNYQFDKLPANLAQAVAERSLDPDSAEGKVAIGAFLAVEPNGDRRLAHRLWTEAGQQGANVAGLLADLDSQP